MTHARKRPDGTYEVQRDGRTFVYDGEGKWKEEGMRVDVLIGPYATATAEEQQAVRLIQGTLLEFHGVIAIWPPDVTEQLLDDDNPGEREQGKKASQAIVAMVAACGGQAHVVGERITEGMREDLAAWRRATPRTATHYRLMDLE